MQRTRDWRRAEWKRHYRKWLKRSIMKYMPYHRVRYIRWRNDERIEGYNEVDYNRPKFKQETKEIVEREIV